MAKVNPNLAVIIPTFKREAQLEALLEDLTQQDELPDLVVVVDGAPEEKNLEDTLRKKASQFKKMLYIPSNHPNAPYQRYLGSQAVNEYPWIVFFDDDIRLPDQSSIRKLLIPFGWENRTITGVTAQIEYPGRKLPEEQKKSKRQPGSLTPVGDRLLPNDDEEYAKVEWLRGGVMAYQTRSLLQEIYNEDVFSLSHIRCGLGVDDTFLSRQVMKHGELILANCVTVLHPDLDSSRAYPTAAYSLGYARAYSRRFLNDHYRIIKPPTLSDRLALLKSYLGNNLLNFLQAMIKKKTEWKYFLGYLKGSYKGIFHPPSARKLAPSIKWEFDAQKALSQESWIK